MKLFDRHDRLTAEAIKAGYEERGSNATDTRSWRVRWSGERKKYLVEWWGDEGLRRLAANTLPEARYTVRQLLANKTPTYSTEEYS